MNVYGVYGFVSQNSSLKKERNEMQALLFKYFSFFLKPHAISAKLRKKWFELYFPLALGESSGEVCVSGQSTNRAHPF